MKSQLFGTIISEVTKGVANRFQNKDDRNTGAGQSDQGGNMSYGGGYQPNYAGPGGYPSGGYPGQPGDYPGQPGGYPSQPGGYPGHPDGYPGQPGGYPGQPGGYPGQPVGYPGQPDGQPGGYPGQPSGYPGHAGGYPGQPGGYPRQPGGYPGQPGGYPGQPGGYPGPHPVGYPGQGGYPSKGPGHQNPPSIGFRTEDMRTSNQPSVGFETPGSTPYPNTSQGYPFYPGSTNFNYDSNFTGNHPPPPNRSPPYTHPSAPQNHMTGPQMHTIYPTFGQGYAQQSGGCTGQNRNYQNPGQPLGNLGMQGTPTVRPYRAFNPNADAETLRKAMKGLGCDKNKVVNVLCTRANFQRQQIATAFKTMYGKDLISELKSELSGDFEELILALMEPPAKYDAAQLRKAMAGLGTKESVLIEIMCSRTNAQIMEIRNAYQMEYRRNLEQDLASETSGHFKRLLVSMCAAGRDESMFTDPVRANQDAKNLYKAGEQRLGTDESRFNAILAAQNYAQLRLVFQEYNKISKHTIEQAIQSEFSGDIRDGLLALVACIQNRPAYFATLLYNSMAGMGTRDTDLIRVTVTRSEVDLADVRQEFQRMYNKSLESFIKGDCSGAYKDGLITLVRGG